MTQTIAQILSQATFYSDGQDYCFLRLPVGAITAAAGVIAEIGEPFCVLIVDKDEVSMLIPGEVLPDFAARLPGHEVASLPYRLITIDVALDPDLTGFMAAISAALALAGIPILPYAAYTRDHIVVPAAHVDAALSALERLKTSI